MKNEYKNTVQEGIFRKLFTKQLFPEIVEIIFDTINDIHTSEYFRANDERRNRVATIRFHSALDKAFSENEGDIDSLGREAVDVQLKAIKMFNEPDTYNAFRYMLSVYDNIMYEKERKKEAGEPKSFNARKDLNFVNDEPDIKENFNFFYKKLKNYMLEQIVEDEEDGIKLENNDFDTILISYLDAINSRYEINKYDFISYPSRHTSTVGRIKPKQAPPQVQPKPKRKKKPEKEEPKKNIEQSLTPGTIVTINGVNYKVTPSAKGPILKKV